MEHSPAERAPWRRRLVKLFFILLTISFAVDSLPEPVALRGPARTSLTRWQSLLGIWQGPWSMFAPNPSIAHTWLSAEVYSQDGKHVQSWNSPYWPNESAWSKLRHFRSMNFFSQLCSPYHHEAAREYAEHLATTMREDRSSPVRVDLYSNHYKLATPMDGQILPVDELVWVSQSRRIHDTRPNEQTPSESAPSLFLWHQQPGVGKQP